MITSIVGDVAASRCEDLGLVMLPDLTAITMPEPGPASLADAREARRIMDTTDTLFGMPVKIRKETDERIVLSELDRLVQQMVGWRDWAPAAPGLPTLVIPPRQAPEGWELWDGVIQPPPSTYDAEDMFPWGSHFFVSSLGYYADHLSKPKPLTKEELERSWAACSTRSVARCPA